jgi:hypothetical protein
MSLRCESLYTSSKANLVPRGYWLVPTGESWCQVVPVGGSQCPAVLVGEAMPASESWNWLVEPGEIGNVGYNPCSSVQDCNNNNELTILCILVKESFGWLENVHYDNTLTKKEN